MKRITIILVAICACLVVNAQKKIETFDENRWNWMEGTDKYTSVIIGDGQMTLKAMKSHNKTNIFTSNLITLIKSMKHKADYINTAHTFARVPMRAKDNFKLSVKVIIPEFGKENFTLYFNTSKDCLTDEENGGTGNFSTYYLTLIKGTCHLYTGSNSSTSVEKLPFKKNVKNFPMEITITKNRKETILEINGVQIFRGACDITEPCIGFAVPTKQTLHVDEVVVEQASQED